MIIDVLCWEHAACFGDFTCLRAFGKRQPYPECSTSTGRTFGAYISAIQVYERADYRKAKASTLPFAFRSKKWLKDLLHDCWFYADPIVLYFDERIIAFRNKALAGFFSFDSSMAKQNRNMRIISCFERIPRIDHKIEQYLLDVPSIRNYRAGRIRQAERYVNLLWNKALEHFVRIAQDFP